MRATEKNSLNKKYYIKENNYDNFEKEQQKQDYRFNIFLYTSIVFFAIAAVMIITEFAEQLGVLGTVAATICAGGWLGAYTLIVLQEKSKLYIYPLNFSESAKIPKQGELKKSRH